ncbi:MAG: hypothetical protein II336_19535, partial [Loktanella sp.]|nr:hypothetical protein [Loktanella sp.]
MAQAIRRILRQDYRSQIMTWEADNRAIRQSRFDVSLELEKLVPDIMRLRRYRHVLRKMFQGTGAMERPPAYLDHTYLRQEWALAPDQSPPDLPEQISVILRRFPNDIRADTHGNLMLAKRNRRGSVVGYDVVDQAAYAVVETAKCGGDGIGLFGPRDAEAVIIVSDAKAAVLQASLCEDPEPLIITVQQDLSPDSAHHLKELAKGRNCFIALGQAKETKDFRA